MPRDLLLDSIEGIEDVFGKARQNFSISCIPKLGGLASLGAVFSEFDSDPDRVVLSSPFEAEIQTAKTIFRGAAEKVSPSYLFMPPERRLHPLTARSFSYRLEPVSVVNRISTVIAAEVSTQVAARKCDSHVTDIYGFKPYYLTGEKFEEVEDVYLGSISLVRHLDKGNRQIVAVAELAEEDEKAA